MVMFQGRAEAEGIEVKLPYPLWRPRPHELLPLDRIVTTPIAPLQAACRRLASPLALAQDTLVCRVLGRRKMFLDARDLNLSAQVALDGFWEIWTTREMIRRVRPGAVVADVGANLGYFTLLLADLVGPQGRVHAFEPLPRTADLLERTVALNALTGRVSVHRTALGAEEGAELFLHADPRSPGGAHVRAERRDRAAAVATRRMDALAELADVEFVKIDAEGSEPAIWRGMSGLIAGTRLHTVMLEWGGALVPDPVKFAGEMEAAGFAVAEIRPQGGLEPMTAAQLLARPADWHAMLLLRR